MPARPDKKQPDEKEPEHREGEERRTPEKGPVAVPDDSHGVGKGRPAPMRNEEPEKNPAENRRHASGNCGNEGFTRDLHDSGSMGRKLSGMDERLIVANGLAVPNDGRAVKFMRREGPRIASLIPCGAELFKNEDVKERLHFRRISRGRIRGRARRRRKGVPPVHAVRKRRQKEDPEDGGGSGGRRARKDAPPAAGKVFGAPHEKDGPDKKCDEEPGDDVRGKDDGEHDSVASENLGQERRMRGSTHA